MDPRVEAFLRALPSEVRARLAPSAALEGTLLRRLTIPAQPFPVDPIELAAAMGARCPADAADADVLDTFEVVDLALALGCARGEPRALAVFEATFGADMDRAIRKSPTLGLSPEEFRQIVREKLFVPAPHTDPRIASYGARAPLAGWVRVTCARTVIDLARRRDDRETLTDDSALLERMPGTHDPEVELVRRRYAEVLPRAFEAALAKLEPRQRNLLRQRYVHGIAASVLAKSYAVHRATLFTWVEAARTELLVELRVALRDLVAGANLDSVMGVMGSELDLSLRRLLDSRIEDEP